MFSRLSFWIGACGLLVLPRVVFGQTFAKGTVVDSVKAPLAQALVIAFDSATERQVTMARTNDDGEFVLGGLAPKTAYIFSVRKLGFTKGDLELTTPKAGDTLWVDAILKTSPPELRGVKVTASANAAYHVAADEIAKRPVDNALDVVMRYHPRMLGDAYKECRPDTSHLGPPIPPSMPTTNLAAPGRKLDSFPTNPSVFFDTSLAMHGYPPPPQLASPGDTLGKLPPLLYINGVLHSELGMKNILFHIPAEDIAEMTYIDCWDTTYPPEMRNALFVVLKPGKAY